MNAGKFSLAVLMGTVVSAASDQPSEVHIFVRGIQQVDLLVVQGAQQLASEMLRSAGIRIVWESRRGHGAASCSPQVVLEYSADLDRAPDVMAYAYPYGTDTARIQIMYRRIVAKRRRPENVLAHVIVHEVTHVLQGIAHHSDSGIMKARWSREDYRQMEQTPLLLTAADIQLIQLGVAKRIAAASCDKASGYNGPVPQVTRR
jgi:hypothetical protein